MKKVYSILSILILSIFLVSTVSAATWDNVKSYDKDSGTITITNMLGLGGKLADYKLINVTDSVIKVSASGVSNLYSDGTLFSSVDFKNIKGSLENLRDVKFYVLMNESYSADVPIYSKSCNLEKNGTSICTDSLEGTTKEILYKNVWEPYNFETLPKGYYKWRLEASRNPNQKIDFILTAQGKQLNEWAWWNNSWTYKKLVNISTSAGYTGANYATLINVSYDANMNTDFSDIRFINGSENTELDYYLYDKVNSNYAAFYVEKDTNTTTTNSSIYMYYGNAGASDNSNFDNTFSGQWLNETNGKTFSNSDNTGNLFSSQRGFLITAQKKILFLGGSMYGGDTCNSVSLWTDGSTNVANYSISGGAFNAVWPFNSTDTFYIDNYDTVDGTCVIKYGNFGGYPQTDTNIEWSNGDAYESGSGHGTNVNGFAFTALTTTERLSTEPYYYFGPELANGVIVTNLVPSNNSNLTTSAVNLSVNISDPSAFGVTNATIQLWNSTGFYYSNTNSSGLTGFYNWSQTLPDESYIWNVLVYDGTGSTATSENTTFSVDTLAPVFTVYTPTDPQIVTAVPANITLNVSTSDDHLSTCWYYTNDNTTNQTYTCNSLTNVSFSTAGNKIIYIWANDTLGHANSTSIPFLLNLVNISLGYDTSVIESADTNITLNVTATTITNFNATLYWNGTNYSTTYSDNTTLGQANKTITAPSVSSDTSVGFYFTYYLNGVAYNTSVYNQTVLTLTPLSVSSSPCSDLALNYSFLDEGNLTNLSADVQYNFVYGTTGNSSLKTAYGSLTGINNLYVCINATRANYTVSYGEVDYGSTGYTDRRNYLFNGSTLTSSVNNITLYELLSASQTSFQLEVEDTNLNPYVDKYTTLVRWYPDLNEYNVVDMGLTDETGSTVIHVKAEDVDYRIGVYNKNGTLIKLADPVRMVCLVTPCTYTLKISPTDVDYTSFLNIQGALTYNVTTGIWTYTFVDTSQKTSSMNLTVYKLTGSSVYAVCTNTVTAYTGAVSCNTSAYSGNLRGVVYRSASPPVVIAEKIIDTTTSAFSSTFGLFLAFIIGVPVIFIFAVVSPVAAIIGGVLALIPALYFKTINWAILGGIAVLAGIVIHFLKRVR